MIIWGTKVREITEETGSFSCPECQSQQTYKHIRLGKYFTLYFIPVFQYRILQKYVECTQCLSTYKEDVIHHKNTSIVHAENKFNTPYQSDVELGVDECMTVNKTLFEMSCGLVDTELVIHLEMYGDYIEQFNTEQKVRFFAFELGLLDWYYRALVKDGVEGNVSQTTAYYAFLNTYAERRYPLSSDSVLNAWHSMIIGREYMTERELGFDSINNGIGDGDNPTPGHFSGGYFLNATQLDLAA